MQALPASRRVSDEGQSTTARRDRGTTDGARLVFRTWLAAPGYLVAGLESTGVSEQPREHV